MNGRSDIGWNVGWTCANQKIRHMKHVIFHSTFHQTCRKNVGWNFWLVCSNLNKKILLVELENIECKIWSQSNFNPTRFFFIQHNFFLSFFFFFFLLFLCSVKPVQHFVQHGIFLCWMKCWIGLTRPLENSSTFTVKKFVSKSLFK